MKTLLYKSLPADLKSNGFQYEINEWHKHAGELKICPNEEDQKKGIGGFHASVRAIDAMKYVDCEVLALVEVKGKNIIQNDKQCWSEMKIVKTYQWKKKDKIALAIYSAELVEPIYRQYYPNDNRIIKAIKAAKKVLKNDTVKNRKAADAAVYAADAAVYAAYVARTTPDAAEFEKTLDKIEEWIHQRIGF